MQSQSENSNSIEYCRSSDIPELYPHLFSKRQWEWAVRKRHENGFDRALHRIGNRLFVSIPEFLSVIKESKAD